MNSTVKKVFIGIFLVLVLVISAAGLYINSLLNKAQKVSISKDHEDLGISQDLQQDVTANNVINIALFGVDADDGKTGRSDSIMIMTIDKNNNVIKLTSLMRDSYVDIAGQGADKLCHAYAYGGPELAIKTINQNFNLNISDFASVNFTTMPEIIDAIGGVEITVKDYEVWELPGIDSPGTYTLSGDKALAYSRIRHSGNGDYERTDRQRAVLEQVFNKISSAGALKFSGYVSKLLPLVETSLSNTQIIKLGTELLSQGSLSLEQKRFPEDEYSSGLTLKGVWYLNFDKEVTSEHIADFIFNK